MTDNKISNAYGLYVNKPSREECAYVNNIGATGAVVEVCVDFGEEKFCLTYDEFLSMLCEEK